MSAVTTEITEYTETAAALAGFRQKYEKAVFPVATTDGMRKAIEARRELRDTRVALEKRRKEIKEPALRRCQLIDSEAKRITAELEALEEPIDAQIKAEEQRKENERRERERVIAERAEKYRAAVSFPAELVAKAANRSAHDIERFIGELAMAVLSEEWMTPEQREAIDAAIVAAHDKLGDMHNAAIAREAEAAELARQRAELERQQAELAAAQAAARAAQEAAEAATKAAQQAVERAEREAREAQARADREREEQARAAENARREAEAAERAREAREAAAREAAAAEAQRQAEEAAETARLESLPLYEACHMALEELELLGAKNSKAYRALSAAINKGEKA
jgi:colicin import membrane protein